MAKTTGMAHSKKFEMVKEFYQLRFWSLRMTRNAVVKSWITAEEFKEITGKDYEEPAQSEGAGA